MTLTTALIADDEPLLREVLQGLLAAQWPELRVVAQARNGLEAIEQFEALRPEVCFLDIHMPGLSGIQVAQRIGGRAHVVFITAFDHHALEAFEQGAFDYLVKPVQAPRLAGALARLRERMRLEQPAVNSEALIARLAERLGPRAPPPAPAPLRWIRASVGATVRLIPVDDIDFLKSDEKYTLVAWRGDAGKQGEAFIRTPLKALVEQLDPTQFQQIHRSVVVNLNAVSHVTRGDNETADVFFKRRADVLPVSRTFLHLFKAE
jgi:DNA-binding LytR/AlgR family response regulator